jgi:hypothetical protein
MSNQLNLKAMHNRHRGLTPSVAGAYREAASVCLSRHHSPPVEMRLSDEGFTSYAEVAWTPPDSRAQSAWANTIRQTPPRPVRIVV